MDRYEHQIIAKVRSPYREKFGTPRQPGLVKEARGRILFEPEFANSDALRGLDNFSHLWLIFEFHLSKRRAEEWKSTVRPPRLGGNTRLGVFATRSPFRPNSLGLSVVKLESVVLHGKGAPYLEVSGLDLVNDTPIFDIKPYLPYADRVPDASGGFADEVPEPVLRFEIAPACRAKWDELDRQTQTFIEKSLVLDPRPAFQREEREYGLSLAGYEVRCQIADGLCEVLDLRFNSF